MKKLKSETNNKKKVAIVTLIGNYNFGNRLQNYALQETINKLGFECLTLKNQSYSNTKKHYILRIIKNNLNNILNSKKQNDERTKSFEEFDKNVNFYQKKINAFNLSKTNFDYYVVGSDQVWNPYFGGLRDVDLLVDIDPQKRISYSASFGIDYIPDQIQEFAKKEFSNFKAISVREDKGKTIINELTGRKDVEVLVDPTLLLTLEEWDRVAKKPKKLDTKKYILNYFLGELSEDRKAEINRIATQNNCEIINILDKNSQYYECGPSEFLYLEKNAFLVCTDSFHSSVFAFIYNRPFVIFKRQGSKMNMNSRLETLLSKFNLKNREYNEKEITRENLNHNYEESYKLLEQERKKSEKFLKTYIR